MSTGVVDENHRFSFELVAAINPRLMSSIPLQSRLSVSLIAI
jgi:hypothetical protein